MYDCISYLCRLRKEGGTALNPRMSLALAMFLSWGWFAVAVQCSISHPLFKMRCHLLPISQEDLSSYDLSRISLLTQTDKRGRSVIPEWKTEAQSGFFSLPDIDLGNWNPVGTCIGGCSICMALLQARGPLKLLSIGDFSTHMLDCLMLGKEETLTVIAPQHPQKHLIFFKTSWIFIV